MGKFGIILASLLLISPALAQSTANDQPLQNSAPNNSARSFLSNGQSPSSTETQNVAPDTVRIADKIKSHLEQVGFQNVKLMPGSFIVRAEDQNHNPVMMVINPDSITAIHAMNLGPETNDQTTVGQGSGSVRDPDQANKGCR